MFNLLTWFLKIIYLTRTTFCNVSLQLGELLGEGAFGKVYKGFAVGIDGRTEPTVVAVKMLKGTHESIFIVCLVLCSTANLVDGEV